MTISYPRDLPSQLKVARAIFTASARAGVNESPFTAEEQIYVHQGELLEIEISCPPMSGLRNAARQAEEVVAWGLSLNGKEGSFLLPPPGYGLGARGSLAGTPVVMGGGQSGKVLATDGWTPSAANVLKAGDWFQLGTAGSSHLHKVVQAASADVYGQANLDIWPRLRDTPSDNDALTVLNPRGLFRLADGAWTWSIELALLYGISFRAREAI